jgi:aspartate racemase
MTAKKKLGIVGGMGSRAASMLFRKIIDCSPAVTDQEFIEIILHNNSAIPDRTQAIVYGGASPVKEILRSIELFNQNKVDIAVLACITSYHFYEEIQLHCEAEIIHPIALVRAHILDKYPSVKKIGLLATTGTLKTRLFQKEFKDSGIEIVLLNKEDQENIFMESVYMKNGLKSSKISNKAFNLFNQAIPKLIDQGAELIVGGCTEVQIALTNKTLEVPYIDVMDMAAKEVINRCYGMEETVLGGVN